MENTSKTQLLNQQQQLLSKIVPTEISVEQREAMGDVIDRWRLNKGWTPYDNDSQELAIQSWVNVMNSQNIPYTAYNELFMRALKFRADLLNQGKQPPDFGAELMLACWETLSREIEQRRIEEHRLLSASFMSNCEGCFGSKFRFVKSGRYSGVERCSHVM